MNGDFELHHWRSRFRPKSLVIPDPLRLDLLTTPPSSNSYTSLSELISSPAARNAAVNSPTAVEIRIRNRLVKQAAYAYLQPTPSSTETSYRRRRCPIRRALRLLGSCFGFIGRFLGVIRTRNQTLTVTALAS